MSIFGKNKKENLSEPPRLPELPVLPELPHLENFPTNNLEPLPQLPTFPPTSTGNRFSRHAIKEAVSGGMDNEESLDDYPTLGQNMMQEPQSIELKPRRRKVSYRPIEIPEEFHEAAASLDEPEPIFVRIDKFEESINTFEKIKEQLMEIESFLENTKKIKDEEEKELNLWEKEIQNIKQKIDKLDKEIFSKIE